MKQILLLLCLTVSSAVFAQPNDNNQRKEKIEALYVAFITRELQITPTESQKFWPLHNQYDTDLKSLKASEGDELSRQQSILDIKKKFEPRFVTIIGKERTNEFFKKDTEFRKRLLEQVVKKRQGQNVPHRRGNNK